MMNSRKKSTVSEQPVKGKVKNADLAQTTPGAMATKEAKNKTTLKSVSTKSDPQTEQKRTTARNKSTKAVPDNTDDVNAGLSNAGLSNAESVNTYDVKVTDTKINADISATNATDVKTSNADANNIINTNNTGDFSSDCKKPQIDLSDDTLDCVDSLADEFSRTKNMSRKIYLHADLVNIIKKLEEEIDSASTLIDEIDHGHVANALDTKVVDTKHDDISADILDIDGMIKNMKEGEGLQYKIDQYKKIMDKIHICKQICEASKIKYAKCN